MANSVESIWGFVDKHAKEIALGVGAIFLLKNVGKLFPSEETLQAKSEEIARSLVAAALVPPPKPKPAGGSAKLSPAAEKKYWVDMKKHRTALYAAQLYGAMHRADAGLLDLSELDGTDEDAIFKTAQQVAVGRITLAELQKAYSAQIPKQFAGRGWNLLDDLRLELSASDYRKTLQLFGLTPEQAYSQLHPVAKKAATKPKK